MNLRSMALLSFLGMTAACSRKNITNYVVPILPAETIYDSPLISTPDEDSLDVKRAEKVRAVALAVLNQERPLGVIQTKRDTATLEYTIPAFAVSKEGKPMIGRKVLAEYPVTLASSCFVLNGKRYEVFVQNVNEKYARKLDRDGLGLTFLGDKPCGSEYFTIKDEYLSGRASDVNLLPEAGPRILGYPMIQTGYTTQNDTIRVNPYLETIRKIQNIYEQTINDLYTFFVKRENENIQRSVLRNSKTSPER